MEVIIIIIIAVIFYVFEYIGYLRGNSKANKKLKKEIRKIKLTNPYIYYREIPIDYGIGICALLLDYKITLRDLKAAIIDLSAKGYIKIDTKNKKVFSVTFTDKDTYDLLNNEIYLLNWIKKNNNAKIKSFNLIEWEKIIANDAIKIGLGTKRKTEFKKINEKKFNLRMLMLSFIVFIIAYYYLNFINDGTSALELLSLSKELLNEQNTFGLVAALITLIIFLIVSSLGPMLIAFFSYVFFYIIGAIIMNYLVTKSNAYNLKMHKSVNLTSKAIDELQKIYSLGAFLKDFSAFAQRDLDEIVIWERYFSFAYLFGLNDKCFDLKYTQIFKNNYFNLDYEIGLVDFIEVNGVEKLMSSQENGN